MVDGGKSHRTDDEKRALELAAWGIGFVDAGVSGGVWGLENGYALMVGGDAADIAAVKPVFDALKSDGPTSSAAMPSPPRARRSGPAVRGASPTGRRSVSC